MILMMNMSTMMILIIPDITPIIMFINVIPQINTEMGGISKITMMKTMILMIPMSGMNHGHHRHHNYLYHDYHKTSH